MATVSLVHYPANSRYCLNQNSLTFELDRTALMNRLSYLTTKR
ncbi:inovirus-type Gp2 protein [Providencia vermicola]|uniref:Inovirus-type Gp2 protein n=1 Tax=Providencia stuartii TaxID=588 RepID=A0AAI9MUW4_PROST|nr:MULTISPECIES: inovirus-type Gp2 protein [Providencia]ELR5043264.1 inovirus-type Gp2 protein [Providencia rettgeri]MTB41728.1 inovirus Gp2 family protein [Providencia sp. wls1949]MTC09200.1 inovirus Gp2 family protein [Providencia sp. wls1948]ELR5035183.1 inovirus-type Gp2 protein [Providencia stuartii]ELR5141065.1 inovirus-type Gp2 protein [Providencia stuartii]